MKKDQGEEIGSDLEQMIAMLERSEIDYLHQYDGEDSEEGEEELSLDDLGSHIDINDSVRMVFDADGNLLEVKLILE